MTYPDNPHTVATRRIAAGHTQQAQDIERRRTALKELPLSQRLSIGGLATRASLWLEQGRNDAALRVIQDDYGLSKADRLRIR